jgi:hypothetical protein
MSFVGSRSTRRASTRAAADVKQPPFCAGAAGLPGTDNPAEPLNAGSWQERSGAEGALYDGAGSAGRAAVLVDYLAGVAIRGAS